MRLPQKRCKRTAHLLNKFASYVPIFARRAEMSAKSMTTTIANSVLKRASAAPNIAGKWPLNNRGKNPLYRNGMDSIEWDK
ncbi:hypothetical protein QY95_03557 [Bacillus thermotolerans]|uniref:Uncharacterized protein n=1 Tax=Bacillus thermotolerans TaxID=1221996 RepID=A0A0F5HPI2_BACTR|nr:hypothetical protein QY95_03557 [Bacillus thermotolerans]